MRLITTNEVQDSLSVLVTKIYPSHFALSHTVVNQSKRAVDDPTMKTEIPQVGRGNTNGLSANPSKPV